jgi:hypothetical protein
MIEIHHTSSVTGSNWSFTIQPELNWEISKVSLNGRCFKPTKSAESFFYRFLLRHRAFCELVLGYEVD